MKPEFREYFTREFFDEKPGEAEAFFESLLAPRPKTFRINRNKTSLETFAKRWKSRGLPMEPTSNPWIFSTGWDRTIKLGKTPEHLGGHLYVQELSAGMSAEILADWIVDENPDLLVLDMAASPGGKTTQLSELYPHAGIVANEPDKTRIPQLLENIDRMGSGNIAVTNVSGAFFARTPEVFDRILLDAPCSWEGIAYKAPESLDYWNIKNIEKIAKLQKRLLSAALSALKVWGTMVYSTCTMNRVENEQVIESCLRSASDAYRILFMRRYFPHVDEGGGFFIAKIEKIAPETPRIAPPHIAKPNEELMPADARSVRLLRDFCDAYAIELSPARIWRHRDTLLSFADASPGSLIARTWYTLKFGYRLGHMESAKFIPDFRLLRDAGAHSAYVYDLDDDEFARFRTGEHIHIRDATLPDGHIAAHHHGIAVGMLQKNPGTNTLKNHIPPRLRKR